MTPTELRALQPGDVIRSKRNGRTAVVTANHGAYVEIERDGQAYAIMASQAQYYTKEV